MEFRSDMSQKNYEHMDKRSWLIFPGKTSVTLSSEQINAQW